MRQRLAEWRHSIRRRAPGFHLTQIKALASLQPSLSATVNGKAAGSRPFHEGCARVTEIHGNVAAQRVAWDRQPLGDITATAETHGHDLSVHGNAQVRDIKFDAQGSWRLEGDDPGSATLHISRASVASVNAW